MPKTRKQQTDSIHVRTDITWFDEIGVEPDTLTRFMSADELVSFIDNKKFNIRVYERKTNNKITWMFRNGLDYQHIPFDQISVISVYCHNEPGFKHSVNLHIATVSGISVSLTIFED